MVRNPIQNCEANSLGPIQNTIQGAITLVDTWSVTDTIGLDVGDLRLGTSYNWNKTEQTKWSQSVQISVNPGQMVRFLLSIISYPIFFGFIFPSGRHDY
jgi:hypothetical protein